MATMVAAAEQHPWLISQRHDLVWFHGSVVAGLLLLGLFVLLPPFDTATYTVTHPAVLLLLWWGILFDGTHVWATYARSYLAPDAPSRSALPGGWSWSILALGPALALLDAAFFFPAPSQLASAGVLFRSFLVGAYLWAYWHLVRQHYGFLMLYRRRAGEHGQAGARLDAGLLWVGCLYPYLRFSLSDAYTASGLIPLVPTEMLAPMRLLLGVSFVVVMVTLLGVIVSGRLEPFRLGPKHLLLTIVIGFHCLIFAVLDNLLILTAVLTIFHNLQYHRIVWQYEQGLGRVPLGGIARYLALGVLFGIAWYGPRILGVAATESDLLKNMLLGLGWGVAFHHYLVDGMIWRVRRSSTVVHALDAGALPT
ncbi:MAG: hypothetical protein HOP18_06790 [Deltaproteobacteria bacterium]|nr:hypothetical protein [Deltaproteobacteria bacterium]